MLQGPYCRHFSNKEAKETTSKCHAWVSYIDIPNSHEFYKNKAITWWLISAQVPDEYEDGDYTDIWGDYYDNEDDNVAVTQASVTYQRPRINFAKYAKKQSNDSQANEVSSSLPDNIYCDLVSTLSDKCIQASPCQ